MELSAIKLVLVPFLFVDSEMGWSSMTSPFSKSTLFCFPSLHEVTSNQVDKAFTAFVPTPLRPTDFLKL